MSPMKIITWDYKEQPPWKRINEALFDVPHVYIFEVETGTDQFGIVIAEDKTKEAQATAQAFYDRNQFKEPA